MEENKVKKNSRLSKKTNRKVNFKAFVDSNYTDLQAFKKACKNDEDLMIYTCLTKDELKEVIDKIKEIDNFDDQINYLISNQPIMNANLERYNTCVESIAKYLKGYIEFNGRKMSNAEGDAEDWAGEFWAKFFKICEFYRVRWFFPETLDKPTSVTYNPTLYKEFIYICRFAITGERKHLGFLAAQNKEASLFKTSIDENIDDSEDGKSLAEIIKDPVNDSEVVLDEINVNCIVDKALDLAKQYDESSKCYKEIAKFYEDQETDGVDKKIIVLGKIFLYKAGLISPKVIQFMKNLSPTYKARYNISDSRLKRQADELKEQKRFKINKKSKPATWHDIILDNNAGVL
jgi:hypothetical protein